VEVSHSRHCGTVRPSNCGDTLKPHLSNSCVESGLLPLEKGQVSRKGVVELIVLDKVIMVGILEREWVTSQSSPDVAVKGFLSPVERKCNTEDLAHAYFPSPSCHSG
jgi:hypothetical protein